MIASVSAEDSFNIDLVNSYEHSIDNEIAVNEIDDSLECNSNDLISSIDDTGSQINKSNDYLIDESENPSEEAVLSESDIKTSSKNKPVLKDDDINLPDEVEEEKKHNFTEEEIIAMTSELISRIQNAGNNETILIEPGIYRIHNMNLTKDIILQGNGDPREVIIDGEQLGSVFLIKCIDVTARFYNLTIKNGLTYNFGGGICIENGNAYVDNCIFINNTALNDTNGGAISNYGNEENRSYLFVNNTLFLSNHADHDGGAVTTCYAYSEIYNSVFINNSACRDGGAIRVSVYGFGKVQDCIFAHNHADEWAGAYYSWSGDSDIDRCIFVNNTAGTNGGAVMVSGNINITNSLITNNTAAETGGSFYIQQPMYDAITKINVQNNIITNNSSPLGKEVYIKWNATRLLFPNFNNNDWGDEDPTDSDVIDPDNVSKRSRPTITKEQLNLLESLNWGLLEGYSDILDDFYANLQKEAENNAHNENSTNNSDTKENSSGLIFDNKDNVGNDDNGIGFNGFDAQNPSKNQNATKESNSTVLYNKPINASNSNSKKTYDDINAELNNSTFVSENSNVINGKLKMVELFEDDPISSKSVDIKYLLVFLIVASVFLIGLSRRRERGN